MVILFFLSKQVGLLLQLKFVVEQFHAFLLYFSFTQWMFGLLAFVERLATLSLEVACR